MTIQSHTHCHTAHIPSHLFTSQVSAPSEVARCLVPPSLVPSSVRPLDPLGDGFKHRLGVAFSLKAAQPMHVQLFW